ncbi:hypothetical protein ACJRO7_023241 [Eucalyptus globulus]|uniref:MORF/ORRM1/DAG-like MORF domain-containing protein n=1 Tax=Eucalyptus globulus TaxID=34317 RepID=A0ABD3KAM0_EUCGL
MATKLFTRSRLLSKPQRGLASLLSRSRYFSSAPASAPRYPPFLPPLLRYRLHPLSAASAEFHGRLAAASSARASRLGRPLRGSTIRGPTEVFFLDIVYPDQADFMHWLVVMEGPEGDPTRDEIIDTYIKTVAQVVKSEEKARSKIYTVDTGPYYFAFGVNVSAKLAYELAGKTFLDGQAVPCDPEFHEEWVGNNAKANERNGHDDQPRNFDRSMNFERRRENMQNRDFQARDMPLMHNQGMQSPPPQGNIPHQVWPVESPTEQLWRNASAQPRRIPPSNSCVSTSLYGISFKIGKKIDFLTIGRTF